MDDTENIYEILASKLFKYLIVVDKNNEKKLVKKSGEKIPLKDFFDDLDECYSVVSLLKKRNFTVNVGYVSNNDKIEWYTKILRGKEVFSSGPCDSIQESICKATYFLLTKKISPEKENNIKNNIIYVDFKK